MNSKPILTCLLCAACLFAPPSFAGGELEVEPNHTTIGFSVPIAGGLTRVTGKFTEFEISLKYAGEDVLEDVGGWSLVATIETASIDTGIDKRDEHLRQDDFFDAERYPEIRFASERIEAAGDGFVAFGEMTMHGVTKPLELPFTITGTVGDRVTGARMIGAVARTTLSRSDYDVATDFRHTHIEGFLGDEIEIEIHCWLRPASPGLLAQDLVRYDGGLWWNGESFVERSVFAREGVFRSASDREPDAVVDLDRGFVIPPFGDAHNHALGDPRFEAQRDALLAQGIFYLANPNNIARLTEAVRPHVNRPGSLDVIYSNGGLTGPGGHPVQIYDRMAAHLPGWSPEDMDGQAYFVIAGEADLDRRWSEILRGRPDFVKVMLEYSEEHAARQDDPAFYGRRGLDPRLLPRVVERAHGENLRVVVHVSSAADVARAVASGADAVAHLPLERMDEATVRQAAARGVVFVSTLVSHRPTAHVPDLEEVHRHNLGLLRRHRVPVVLGTDSDRGLFDEMREMARLGGYSSREILELAVRTTPRWIFPDRAIGLLADGAEASFLVLESDPLADLGAVRKIRRRIQRGHELAIETPVGKPSIAQRLAQPLMHEGFEAADALYRRLRREEPDAWDFSEPQLNALGYQLLQHGRADLAVEVFALNAELFPDSANVYDSWGEGLMEAGRLDEAIVQYRRSLELAPDNENAREKLRELAERRAAGEP